MNDINLLIDLFLFGSGVYLVYAAVKMKRTGEVQNLLLSKGTEIKKSADVAGFIQNTFGKTVAMGSIGIVAGGVSLYNDYYGGIGTVQLIALIVYGVGLMLYGYLTVRAQKRFLQG